MIEIIEDDGNEYWTDLNYRNVKVGKYEISTEGNVRNKENGKILSTRCKSEKGYRIVALMCNDGKQYTFKLHRIVAYCWMDGERYKGKEVNHRDGNKDDCSIWNLEWCTRLENMRGAYRNNLVPVHKGSDHYNNKYDEKDVRLICSMIEFGLPTKYIKKILWRAGLNVNKTLIDDLRRKRAWKDIVKEFDY